MKKYLFVVFALISLSPLNAISIEQALLPDDHPLQSQLKDLFYDPEMFSGREELEKHGFEMRWNPLAVNGLTILVASHDTVPGYLFKKYRNGDHRFAHVENYLKRIHGANILASYIKEHDFQYLTVPQKWLYRLPDSFSDPVTGEPDYLLIVEEINICDGGWWGGETLDRYRKIEKPVLRELCYALHDLRGCDAWPQNQPFTHDGKIAFIDTEHLSGFYGDFLERTIKFIDPGLVDYALELWEARVNFNTVAADISIAAIAAITG